jgi:hypothetical protein
MRFKSVPAILLALALAATAAAQTKISGTLTCKPAAPSPVEIGDKPGHSFSVDKAECTWPKPIEMAGVADKEAVSVASDEINGSTMTGHGYHMGTMSNGDKYVTRFQGSAKLKDGKPVATQGTWSFVSGTGKLKGIKGKGTYKGGPNPDGTMTYQVEGEYSLP